MSTQLADMAISRISPQILVMPTASNASTIVLHIFLWGWATQQETLNTGAAGVVITENSKAVSWGGDKFIGNDPADVYSGPLNRVAAATQLAKIGFTNYPSRF